MFKLIVGRWKDEVGDAMEELEKNISKFSKDNNYDEGNIVQYTVIHEPSGINNPNYIYIATALVSFYPKASQVAPLLVSRAEEPARIMHSVNMMDMTGDPIYPES